MLTEKEKCSCFQTATLFDGKAAELQPDLLRDGRNGTVISADPERENEGSERGLSCATVV